MMLRSLSPEKTKDAPPMNGITLNIIELRRFSVLRINAAKIRNDPTIRLL
jgi:hypothetical protein